MLTPQPQSAFTQIVDVLESIKQRDKRHAFKLNRYKKQADDIIKISPASGYTLLGILACLEHDIDAMHRYHKMAIAYDPSYATYSNYSASLDKSFLWRASFLAALAAAEAEPTDKTALRCAMTFLPLSGKFSMATKLSARWAKISGGEADPLAWIPQNYSEFCEINGISENEIQQALDIVESVLSETTAIVASYACTFVSDDSGTPYLFYSLTFHKGADTFSYETLLDDAFSSSELSENVKDKVIISIVGGDTADAISSLDVMTFNEDDLVEVDSDRLELVKHLIEGITF